MTYKHLTIDEITMIESYFHQKVKPVTIAKRMCRAIQTIYTVVNFFKQGFSAIDYWHRYKENKKKCGRKRIEFSDSEKQYIKEKVAQDWTPDVIIGRQERMIPCSMRTLYRKFSNGEFDVQTLPMKGRRKPNGHQETRGKQAFKRTLDDRTRHYPNFKEEFGHLEGDTIVGVHHKSAVITLVERVSKVIITLKPKGRKANDIEEALNHWFERFPKHFFKSITFDCGKEFSNWKSVSNQQDIDIFFADPGTPSQRALNEHSNGLLRRDGLPKSKDFRDVSQEFISSVSCHRNYIPRKSLNYQTPIEVFLSYVQEAIYSSLI
ncbi:IS30 family transposase [Vagococcus elongatus]|uniref:IS30 family transposase n=1 Tax=Vagococcus elongatus TaxID=180344 RepID=A0A430AQ02_9ENTE|nr:IS30 family transposase [Vagococcus elongatus]RSU10004.1 IS30 family transposase [Vagococcus elongatus]